MEIDPEDRPAHRLIAENFRAWIGAVRNCLEEAKDRLAAGAADISARGGGAYDSYLDI